jgi:SAM-dependent methyltransferase
VLEIGCATGRLLSLLREAGFNSIQGLDPSPGCGRAAWDLYRVPVMAGSVFDISAPRESFDLAILVGVLEHVENVRGALGHVRRVLSSGGLVYAEVPDAAHLAGHPDAAFQEFSTEHINFFSIDSLANLFQMSGFEVVTQGERLRPQRDNTSGPAAFGVFRKSDRTASVERDRITEPGLQRYIDQSAGTEAHTRVTLEKIAGAKPLLVWGAGTHSQRLLAVGAFRNVTIAAFVDSNPKYQGRNLSGVPVIAPSAVVGRTEPILISTRGFQSEIQHQIRVQLKLDNEIILLYP